MRQTKWFKTRFYALLKFKGQKKTEANFCLVYILNFGIYFLESQTILFSIAHCFNASRASTAG
jgi:hypothetical protein